MMQARRGAWIVAVAALAAATLEAQRSAPPGLAWQFLPNGPMAGNAFELVESTEGVLLAQSDALLYRSTDDGRTWIPCRQLRPRLPAFFPSDPLPEEQWFWHTIAQSERGVVVAENLRDELRVTNVRCESFGFVPVPRTTSNIPLRPVTFHYSSQNVLALTAGGVFVSPFPGSTRMVPKWRQTLPVSGGSVCATSASVTSVLVVDGKRAYRSSDSGISWTEVPDDAGAAQKGTSARGTNPGLACPIMQSMNSVTLYGRGPGGLWRSSDDGMSWTRVFQGSISTLTATERRISLTTSTREGAVLMRSEDQGATWTAIPFLRELRLDARRLLDTTRGTLLAATTSGVFRSDDRGQSWARTGFNQWDVTLAADGQRVYAADRAGVWRSEDAGMTWFRTPSTVDGGAWSEGNQLLHVFDTGAGRILAALERNLVLSEDRGSTWRSAGLDKQVTSLVKVGGIWYAGTTEGVFRSPDLASWVECSSGLGNTGALVATAGGDLVMLSSTTSRSIDGCRSWWSVPTGTFPTAGPFVFALSSDGVLSIGGGIAHLNLTTRQWSDWKDATELTVISAAADGRNRYWLGTAHGVYVLVVNGSKWDVWPMGLDGERILSLAVDSSGYLLAAVESRGLFRASIR
jgi:photosystem II stability/assembly factor-like uncharacterized protein